jgi:hypothetical protein
MPNYIKFLKNHDFTDLIDSNFISYLGSFKAITIGLWAQEGPDNPR